MALGGGLGRGRRRRHLNAEVNIINLVDVVLVLLIIFMVTAPMMQSGIEVRLPKAVARPLNASTKDLTVAVLRNGDVRIDGRTMSAAEFRDALPRMIASRGVTRAFVQGDRATSHGDMTEVYTILQHAGIAQMGIVSGGPGSR